MLKVQKTWTELSKTLWEMKQRLYLSHIEQTSLWLPQSSAVCCDSSPLRSQGWSFFQTPMDFTVEDCSSLNPQFSRAFPVIPLPLPYNFALALRVLGRFLGIYRGEKSTLLPSFYICGPGVLEPYIRIWLCCLISRWEHWLIQAQQGKWICCGLSLKIG